MTSQSDLVKNSHFTPLNLFDPMDQPLPVSCMDLRPLEECDSDQLELNEYSSMSSSQSQQPTIPLSLPKVLRKETPIRKRRPRVFRKLDNDSLLQEMSSLSILNQNHKFLEGLIIKHSQGEIYNLGVGFDSEEEDHLPKRKELPHGFNLYNTIKIQAENQSSIQKPELVDVDNYFSSSELAFNYLGENKSKQKVDHEAPEEEVASQGSTKTQLTHIKTILSNMFSSYPQFGEFRQISSITEEDKKLFIRFRNELIKLRALLEEHQKANNSGNDHFCRICGLEFENGRQLGGHMSRKHPGRSEEYGVKRQVHRAKNIERKRRNYFKSMKIEVKIENL